MNKYIEEAKAIRASISGLAKKADDETLINNKDAFPYWNGGGVVYKRGDIVQYLNKVYRVLLDHVSQLDWTPIVAVSLFTEISLDEFPDWMQPTGAHDAYAKGDKCSHNGKHWVSNIDSNVWEPGVTGWDEIE